MVSGLETCRCLRVFSLLAILTTSWLPIPLCIASPLLPGWYHKITSRVQISVIKSITVYGINEGNATHMNGFRACQHGRYQFPRCTLSRAQCDHIATT
ncbi:hypothetical protein OG21DRAFT_151372 [Imleria badia]|nr:hypothetical protein OG21DRAFT_151372 [Imleria badia]